MAQSRAAAGAIEGSVVDSTGAAMAGVRVTASSQDSGASRFVETDDSGQFHLPALPAGTYKLRIEKAGFSTVEVEAFPVSVGQSVIHHVAMKPAQLAEKVEVREKPEALEAAATIAGVALGSERVDEAPSQNRNYLNIVLTAPGVAPSGNSNTQRATAALRSAVNDSGFSFAGLRGRNNSLSIDGVDNRDETTGGNRVAVGLEMVQEFRVSGTAVGAEFGGAAGGIVNVVTYSGTNIWHGDGTFFAQHEILNARNPEDLSSNKPRFRRYQPGVSLIGPMRRDRTFFASALEQEWESEEEWSDTPEGALEAIRAALRSSPFARSSVKTPERGLFGAGSSQTEFSFKLTHVAGPKHSLWARYAFSRGRVSQDVQGGDNFADRSSRGSSLTLDHSLVAGWTAVPSARLVHDLRFQFGRRRAEITPNARGAMLEVPGVVTLGQAYRLDSARTEDHYELVDSVNVALGRHQLSLGGSLHEVRLDSRMANRFGGTFIFPTLADFLRGAPDVFLQAFGEPATALRTLPAGVWLQDRWQLATGLTVEAGLRYDRQAMPRGFPSANRNLAPRLGVAWRPSGRARYVIRAGFGLFYDRYPLAFLNDVLQKDGIHGLEQYAAGQAAEQAFAAGLGGTLAAPLAGVGASVYRASADFPTTYSRKFTAGVERSFGKDTSLTGEFSYVRAFHLPRIRNVAGGLPALYELEQTAKSSYQGAAVSLNRRMAKELSFLVAYTAGRTYDDASDFDEHPLDPADLRRDWARSRQHQAHRVAASALFDLPVEGMKTLPAWLRESLERVTVAPILTWGTGRPLNALDSTDTFRTGAYPISARPFGLGRNPFFSPATLSLDLRVMKTFPLKRERERLQTGLEAFNLGNHTNPLRVSPFYAARGERLSSYGRPVETLNARQIQFLIQIEY